MSGVTYTDAIIGLMIGSALFWAPIFAIAYVRNQSRGSPRSYFLAFASTWFATVAFFVLLSLWENQTA